jgi:small conductance mechanosensitive channel
MLNILNFISKKQVYGTIIILVLTYVIYKIVNFALDKIEIKGKDELERKRKLTTIVLLKNIIKYILIIFMTIILLNLYGVNTTSLIAGLGVAGVTLAFGLQEALKDIVSGIGIIFDNYFVVGDIVDYNGFIGTVTEFGLKSTKIKKVTGEVLIISNRNIDRVINISQERAAVVINIPTAYEEKYDKVEKVLKDTLERIKELYTDIKIVEYLGIEEFSESSIVYSIRFTCARTTQWDMKRLVLKEIKQAYDKNKIKIPYKQVEVHNGKQI